MARITQRAALPDELLGGVVALGNFDGFHEGHQTVVGHARDHARAHGLPLLVATFDPHPARFFAPGSPPFALTRMDQRLDLLEAFGVDGTVVIPFDAQLAATAADGFVDQWLVARLAARHVVTGWDFTYGKGRSGSVADLARVGRAHGFSTESLQPVTADGAPVSSTRVREALRAGDPRGAARLLTRPFAIRGTVEHGDKIGRILDFPTANVALGDYLRPKFGVYAVHVRLPDGSRHDGVANLGIRPMFDPPREMLETYIFDWSGELYGAEVEVELVDWLRPELKLDGLDALKAQIAADCVAARKALHGF